MWVGRKFDSLNNQIMAEVSHVDLVRTLYGHSSDVTSLDFRGNILATCSSDKTVRLWSYENSPDDAWELPHSPLLGHKYTVHNCCFSPHQPLLVTCSTDGNIFLWNIENGEIEATLKHPSGLGVRVCTMSQNGNLLATAGEDDCIVIWDVNTHSLLRSFEGHDATVNAVTFTPDGAYLVSGSGNCDIALWDAQYGGEQWLCRTLEAHDLGVLGADFSPTYVIYDEESKESPSNTFMLATCGNDCLVRLWHVKTGNGSCSFTKQQELQGHSANVFCCKFSSDGRLLASTAGDKTVIIWDPMQGAILQKLERHSRYVTCCAFTFDGQYLATGSNDKTVIIWKLHRDPKTCPVPIQTPGPATSSTVEFATAQSVFKASSAPDEYHCPITHELMRDPVIAADGFTYERTAIAEWFQSGKDTSPMTNHRLSHMQLISNLVLRMLIQRHKEDKN